MFRSATHTESQKLTEISFASKAFWEYPKEYFEIWENELTISSEYIKQNLVFVFEHQSEIKGYYSIVELKENTYVKGVAIPKGFWLEHMFLSPCSIGKGIGTNMFHHLRETCLSKRIHELGILADPNSKGFYEKMGCRYQREFPSTIPNRTTPWFVLKISQKKTVTVLNNRK